MTCRDAGALRPAASRDPARPASATAMPPEHAGQQRRLPRIPPGQPVDLLGERLALAIGSRAEEPSDRQQDLHLPAPDRGIG
jgi:hypothetical protein